MSITLDQVTKRYQAVPVVNDVSLKIEPGEFLVLLGPSGSGKSTLLRAIAGLTEIDHGRIALHGRDVTAVPSREREVGFVFQHYALFSHMSVANNIEFALQVRGVRAAERRARRKELLRLVALDGMDERLPSELSGGQQQRVAVARALAHRPQVLLMDEPFGALDARIREELRRTIRQIQRELGIATILVTHDQEEAFALADRIGVMNQGRLLECGSPDDLYTRPATRFVATFLGAANLLLGYRTPQGVRFAPSAHDGSPAREVVAVLRPEEVELAATATSVRANFVGFGEVTEVLFAGSIERLRVRMPEDGPVPVAPGRDDAVGSLLEVSRTLPEQRDFPAAVGSRVAVGARRIHVLPTPISSFTVIAADPGQARALRDTPLVNTLAERMQTRVAIQVQAHDTPPPGMPVMATGAGSAARVEWLLQHGAEQVLCVPADATLPWHVVIFAPDAAARDATLAVAASLLRHTPAAATYLSIHPSAATEQARGAALRELLDARTAALSRHGLDMRTETRFGEVGRELLDELQAHEHTMLVLGIADLATVGGSSLAQILEGTVQRPLLVVRRSGAESDGGA
ncbi:MAG: ABC transporter ATP-binding protein [Steroidobacteraceae bacterium]|nr:ABC transporter ATP-binding protein [Steroidobacteraceae bacterium]